MRRPHVYERSAPRGQRPAYQEPASDAPSAARELVAALPALVDKAEAAGLTAAAALLRQAFEDLRSRTAV